jgi:putative oxidoreductase
MKKKTFLYGIITLLTMMFIYASFSKLFDFAEFQRAMYHQPFPHWMSSILIWILPALEIAISILLIKEKTQRVGLITSLCIITLFTLYIGAILIHLFPKVPCSCGGLIRLLTWPRHLIFNLFFLSITIIGLIIQSKTELKVLRKE